MTPNEVTRDIANQYAQINGMKILSEVEGAVVVELPNGSISNVNAKTISSWANQQQIQGSQQNGNKHSASTNDINEVINDHAGKKLYSLGIDASVKSTAELTDQMRVNAMSQGINSNELSNLIQTRNVQSHKTAQNEYMQNKRQAEQDAKLGHSRADMRERESEGRQAAIRASHGLGKQHTADYLTKEINQPTNAANVEG